MKIDLDEFLFGAHKTQGREWSSLGDRSVTFNWFVITINMIVGSYCWDPKTGRILLRGKGRMRAMQYFRRPNLEQASDWYRWRGARGAQGSENHI